MASLGNLLNRAGLVPHNDMCETMAWAAARANRFDKPASDRRLPRSLSL